jgi:hypothetical protein
VSTSLKPSIANRQFNLYPLFSEQLPLAMLLTLEFRACLSTRVECRKSPEYSDVLRGCDQLTD